MTDRSALNEVALTRALYLGKNDAFLESHMVCKEPIGLFKEWFEGACKLTGLLEPNAMCLATASASGVPSARYVLLKDYGPAGFSFFTNYSSRKGKDLAENPRAALVFYWEPLRRSVRIEGKVEKINEAVSDEYFQSRPLDNQIGACVSNQSSPVASRDYLMSKAAHLKEKSKQESSISRPDYWGGFVVVPESVEFWQGQTDRLHDRIRFRKPNNGEKPDGTVLHAGEGGWVYERLAP